MAAIGPFAAVRYDLAEVGTRLEDLIAPPYDVISSARQAALYSRHPCNVVRLILARDPDPAHAAARTFSDWLERGVLRRDPAPAVYRYEVGFPLPGGLRRHRDGIICRLRLEPFSSGHVRPHERTFPGPKANRLALLRAVGAHLSPVFALYSRPGERLADLLGGAGRRPPDMEAEQEDGVTHRLWRIGEQAALSRIRSALVGEALFIADGHHRYETALAYRDELGGAGASGWVLACLSNMEEDGLVVLPTHRLVGCALGRSSDDVEALLLGAGFVVEPLPAGGDRPRGAIDCVLPDRALRLRPRRSACDRSLATRRLDVVALHEHILEPLGVPAEALAFTHDDAEACAAVATGRAAAAFLLNPPAVDAIREVCLAGGLMPQKSTYFYPKLASGLVFHLAAPRWLPR